MKKKRKGKEKGKVKRRRRRRSRRRRIRRRGWKMVGSGVVCVVALDTPHRFTLHRCALTLVLVSLGETKESMCLLQKIIVNKAVNKARRGGRGGRECL
jgi:hypothetical protein